MNDHGSDYPNRGPRASVSLWFHGSGRSDRSSARLGARAFITVSSPGEHPVTNERSYSGAIGNATDEVAAYMALITSMRAVIRFLTFRSMRHYYSELIISGQNELVIEHMKGIRTVEDRLAALHEVAKGIELEFRTATYHVISSEENREAQSLANRDCTLEASEKAVYYPCLGGLVDAWVGGHRTLASHDFMAHGADPIYYIDARFLRSLPGGKMLLRNLRDPYPLALINAKEDMTPVGTIKLEVGMCWKRGQGVEPRPLVEGPVNVTVVESLPVPLHVSTQYPSLQILPEGTEIAWGEFPVPLEASSLDGHFRDHPYWQNDTPFVPGP